MYAMSNQKTVNLHSNYHNALQAIKDERGASINFSVHMAVRVYLEWYFPDKLHLLEENNSGDELTRKDDTEAADVL